MVLYVGVMSTHPLTSADWWFRQIYPTHGMFKFVRLVLIGYYTNTRTQFIEHRRIAADLLPVLITPSRKNPFRDW